MTRSVRILVAIVFFLSLSAARAGEKVRELASVSAAAFAQAKALLRRPALSALAATRNADADSWLDVWFSEPAQAQIAGIVARLKAPRGA